jgi:hypothetical protein
MRLEFANDLEEVVAALLRECIPIARGTVASGKSANSVRCLRIVKLITSHRFGWVFETPVDAEALGLHDYGLVPLRTI